MLEEGGKLNPSLQAQIKTLQTYANSLQSVSGALTDMVVEAERIPDLDIAGKLGDLKEVTAQTQFKRSGATADALGRIGAGDAEAHRQVMLQTLYDLELQYAKTAEVAVESFNIQDEAAQIFSDTFETAFDGVAMGTQSVSQAFENMSKSILVQIAKLAATQFFGNALSGQGGTLGAIGDSLLGNAKGNAFSGGNVIPFAKGGVVSSPTLFPMANGAGLMGEGAGPEAILPLSRMSNGNLGVEAQAMNVTVNNNAPGVDISTRQTESGLTVDVVAQTIASAIQRGGNDVANALENTYSLGRGRAVY
jgi:phage-related minor tail protein